MMMKYRVTWREHGKQEWQIREFGADRQSALCFHREQRRTLKAAILQWWNEREERWIG
jgi:hypothetical protein